MPAASIQIGPAAEGRLRAVIAKEFRRVATGYRSERAAAESLGISRQRFRKYLDKKMTPKADILLGAMAKWNLKIVHEGVIFCADFRTRKIRPVPPEQLRLDYFDEPQILRNDQRNVEVRVSRKQSDTLKFAVEVRLAG